MIMPETRQDEILKQGIESNFLLTEDALAKHNLLTGASELREFACGRCDHYWWKVVLVTKAVSICYKCKIKLDALPRHLEFGIGRYICQNTTCDHRTFFGRCQATDVARCLNCNDLVRNPYIHPKFRKSKQKRKRKPLNPDAKPFKPPPPSVPYPPLPLPMYFDPYYQQGPLPPPLSSSSSSSSSSSCSVTRRTARTLIVAQKRNVINPSTPHVPTGSTIDTFLTQKTLASDVSVDIADSASVSSEEIILVSSDSDSSSDEEKESQPKCVLSDDESDVGVGSICL